MNDIALNQLLKQPGLLEDEKKKKFMPLSDEQQQEEIEKEKQKEQESGQDVQQQTKEQPIEQPEEQQPEQQNTSKLEDFAREIWGEEIPWKKVDYTPSKERLQRQQNMHSLATGLRSLGEAFATGAGAYTTKWDKDTDTPRIQAELNRLEEIGLADEARHRLEKYREELMKRSALTRAAQADASLQANENRYKASLEQRKAEQADRNEYRNESLKLQRERLDRYANQYNPEYLQKKYGLTVQSANERAKAFFIAQALQNGYTREEAEGAWKGSDEPLKSFKKDTSKKYSVEVGDNVVVLDNAKATSIVKKFLTDVSDYKNQKDLPPFIVKIITKNNLNTNDINLLLAYLAENEKYKGLFIEEQSSEDTDKWGSYKRK